ncbi:MAG: dimethyl sulfoxide reductase anchor subunit [Rhodobacterales bacterium]
MQPAASVIIFTSLSGLGFGLLFFLGLGRPAVSGWIAFAFFFIAYALAVGGLLASTFHLGNPQRAMKAFSQWRSSWLSREGVVAVAALLVMGLYAAFLLFADIRIAPLGWLGSFLSIGAVFCTSMIYAQLKTVPRWHMSTTPLLFVLYALAGGGLLSAQLPFAVLAMTILTAVQILSWLRGDLAFDIAGHSVETATGLGNLGKVRLLESPHSGENYLTREMVFIVGRKHAVKLRVIAALCIGIIPVLILAFVPITHITALLAISLHVIGLFISRWLFFAEAEHVVGLYYDQR